jgi:phosphocarrier protein HPr
MVTAAQELPQGQGPLTARRRVVFTQASGLHLRLADQLVRRAAAFQADIWLEGPGGRANGKSILDLMALAAACGTTLEIEARGPDAEEAVAALAALIGAGFEASEEGGRRPRAASCPATGRILRTETGADPGGRHGANYSLGVPPRGRNVAPRSCGSVARHCAQYAPVGFCTYGAGPPYSTLARASGGRK